MAWWNVLISPISSIFKAIVGPIQERSTLKAETAAKVQILSAEAEVARANARVEMAKQGQIIESNWDNNAQQQMRFSWKDEVLLFVFVGPFVAAFIPPLQPYVKSGFEIIAKIPLWWRVAVLGIVAAVYGLRWLIAPLVTRWVKKIGGA